MSATTDPLLDASDDKGTLGTILHELGRIAKNESRRASRWFLLSLKRSKWR